MSRNQRSFFTVSLLFIVLFFFLLLAPAFAAEGARGWRPVYDVIMRWVNFAILVVLLVKVVGPLLTKFLSGQQTEIREKIERVQSEKNSVLDQVQEAQRSLENAESRLEIRKRIIDMGELRKQQMIDEAREHSEMIMKHARIRIDNQINLARNLLLNEIVDLAVEKALNRLPEIITPADNDTLIEHYLMEPTAN
jgi:F-type H+-transporting ATPase subunit b